jgi:adenylate kinase family enzyme
MAAFKWLLMNKPMSKIIIFGNSGSGKSTLAKQLTSLHQLAHFDLDSIAWQPTTPPTRAPIEESEQSIAEFIRQHKNWVIEGCYSDLLAIAAEDADELIFLDVSVDQCIANAKKRPWEPHKYASKAEQDANLSMLIDWIKAYNERDDEFSRATHQALFDSFAGKKSRHQKPVRLS